MTLIQKLRYMGKQYAAGQENRNGGRQKHYLEEAADEIDRLRGALEELVALKDLKDRLHQLHEMGHGTDYDDYHRRKPVAWAAARAALQPNV